MSKPTIKSLTEQLAEEKRLRRQAEEANISLQSKVAGSPTLQHKLNMANATVAELMKEVETLKLDKIRTGKAIDSLKSSHDREIEQLKSDYALLEEKYYTQSDSYTELNKRYNALFEETGKINAENHALKAEIERTNRHINLAENQLNKEQQPLVVNHYHNCTINK